MTLHKLTLDSNNLYLQLNAWLQREFNISLIQFYFLKWLTSKQEVVLMTDVARQMGHCKAAATTMIKRLEKLGYVERTNVIHDRREVAVTMVNKSPVTKGTTHLETLENQVTAVSK